MSKKQTKKPKEKKQYIPQPVDIVPFDDFKDQLCSWKSPLKDFINSPKFQDIYKFIKDEYQTKTVKPKEVFTAFQLTPLENVRVVVVGQDPYHQPGQAHGLCFSVKKPENPPPSLKNMFKNLANDKDLSFKMPNHGDLTKWAKQGVFLLNPVLTVQRSNPQSHQGKGWQQFTDLVIRKINSDCKNVVFLLWGGSAKKKASCVDRKKHKILQTSHPSPLSAHNGFMTSRCFWECNKMLREMGEKEIDWNLD